MPDGEGGTPPAEGGEPQTQTGTQEPEETPAVKQARRENQGLRRTNKELTEKLAALEEQQMSETEKATEKAVAAARKEAEEAFKRDLVRERVMARATGKLTDPEDAVRYLKLDDLSLDNEQIDTAITELLTERAYLANTPGGKKGPVLIDQGPQGSEPPATANEWLRRSMGGR